MDAKELKIEGTADTCPQCGYKDGFHVSFAEQGGKVEIVLICPQCSSRFAVGWPVEVSAGRE
jgi:hypothetical protein